MPLKFVNIVMSGINKVKTEDIESALVALGLKPELFHMASLGGYVALITLEDVDIDGTKLMMLRATLNAWNDN